MLQSATQTSRRVKQVPLELYAKLLGFESQQQAMQFAFKHKVGLGLVDYAGHAWSAAVAHSITTAGVAWDDTLCPGLTLCSDSTRGVHQSQSTVARAKVFDALDLPVLARSAYML